MEAIARIEQSNVTLCWMNRQSLLKFPDSNVTLESFVSLSYVECHSKTGVQLQVVMRSARRSPYKKHWKASSSPESDVNENYKCNRQQFVSTRHEDNLKCWFDDKQETFPISFSNMSPECDRKRKQFSRKRNHLIIKIFIFEISAYWFFALLGFLKEIFRG